MTGFDQTVPPDDDPDRDENAADQMPAEKLTEAAESTSRGDDEATRPEHDGASPADDDAADDPDAKPMGGDGDLISGQCG